MFTETWILATKEPRKTDENKFLIGNWKSHIMENLRVENKSYIKSGDEIRYMELGI